jgi:hypothetical protein
MTDLVGQYDRNIQYGKLAEKGLDFEWEKIKLDL